jgi:ABC-type transport system substrate-binding protein
MGRRKSPANVVAMFKMRLAVSALIVLASVCVGTVPLEISTAARAKTLQMSSENSVTGWYPNEPTLSPSNLSDGDSRQLFNTRRVSNGAQEVTASTT